jgi:hypothetical protein
MSPFLATIERDYSCVTQAGRKRQCRPLAVSLKFRVRVIDPEHRPSHPLAGAFVKAVQSEAAALRLQLKSHSGPRWK